MANEERLGAILEIRDNASRTLETLSRVSQHTERSMSTLANVVERLDRNLEASERQTEEIVSAIRRLGQTSGRAEREVESLGRAMSRLGSVGGSAISRLGTAMGGVLGRATQLAAVFGTLAGGGALMQMFKGGAAMEQHQLNTRLNLQNWNGLSDTQALVQSKEYLGGAEKYANYTPFSTDDVLAASSRALGVAQGDTKRAESLYKFAGDMTSSVPGGQKMFSPAA